MCPEARYVNSWLPLQNPHHLLVAFLVPYSHGVCIPIEENSSYKQEQLYVHTYRETLKKFRESIDYFQLFHELNNSVPAVKLK